MPNLRYAIETTRWTRSVDGARATIRLEGRCPDRRAPLVLEELIERVWDRDTGLIVRFDTDVAEPLRVGITAAMAHLIRATAPEGLVEGASEVEGWIGPRYTVDDRLESEAASPATESGADPAAPAQLEEVEAGHGNDD